MAFEDLNAENKVSEEISLPEEATNRTFLFAIGGLGLLLLVGLGCLAAFALFIVPNRKELRAQEIQQVQDVQQAVQQQTAIAQAVTLTSAAYDYMATATATLPPPTATETPVVAIATNTLSPTKDAHTATVAALLTQAASALTTLTPGVSTTPGEASSTQSAASYSVGSGGPASSPSSLPKAGFADEVGLPGLLGMSAVLMFVFFFARRIRAAMS